jgi:replicative DNA helicase
MSDEKTTKTMKLAKDLAEDYIDHLEAKITGQRHYTPSGFKQVDKKLGGWLHEGHLIVIAGRPAMGKSAFAQQLVESVADQGKTALLFTLEMSGYEITERSVSRRSGIPIPKLKTGEELTSSDQDAIMDALREFRPLPFLVDDASFGIEQLVEKTIAVQKGLAAKGLPPLGVIAVDYLQLVTAGGSNRTIEIGQVTGGLKRLAKDLKVPVIALSQLNRAVESKTDKRPGLSDLRESGNIEQDADLVLFLYRDEYYNQSSDEKGIAEVICGKNRHGATGTVKLAFVGERVMFGDLAYDYQEIEQQDKNSSSQEIRTNRQSASSVSINRKETTYV